MRRIKRLAFVGTGVLLVVCFGLYQLLEGVVDHKRYHVEETSRSVWKHSLQPTPQRRTSLLFRNGSGKCWPADPNPLVDIQMGRIYEQIPFDNPDGGVWKQGWDVSYDSNRFSQNKLKIFVVPHSHNDPGWKKTFEDYYKTETRSILNNMVPKLLEDPRRKFIWAEISFFSLWWSEISLETKENVKKLIKRGQLELVAGGWVMPDEANSHYYSILEQLILGHQWLVTNLGFKPKSSWSIDPFGLSPTLPLILKGAGIDHLAVQRSHYSVKKYLARHQQLEFRWRQLWDGTGTTELLTHMMPFYSYDVPHTCGPDPKVCCQFDFRRLPGFGVTCPWRASPKRITDENVAERSEKILDQYKKKATLYSTNVLLVPLGDDFRYMLSFEWDAQFDNYQRLFDHINSNPKYNAHAQFGTLTDYFTALIDSKPEQLFPSLSGDFFTYADRDDHYWSGYYTSRPYYKRMDRLLMSSMRSAEIIFALANLQGRFPASARLWNVLDKARASHSLFQHHDGVTGTAKDAVVQDYAQKMLDALSKAHHVIQQSANFLLSNDIKDPDTTGDEVHFVVDADGRLGPVKQDQILTFPSGISSRLVTFFNSLARRVVRPVHLRVDSKSVRVTNSGSVVAHQISPICSLFEETPNCYLLSFFVDLAPLGLDTYSIEPSADSNHAEVSIKLFDSTWAYKFDDWSNKEVIPPASFTIWTPHVFATFSESGLLQTVMLLALKRRFTTKISFVRYSARSGSEQSGAYLFLPDGPAKPFSFARSRLIVLEGPIRSQVLLYRENLVHCVSLYKGEEDSGVEIENVVDVSSVNSNIELAMRITSNVVGGVFYTDLNGLQMIRRKFMKKIPLQGNFYPMGGAAYFEDNAKRITLLSGQPLGVASLRVEPTESYGLGQIDVMLDRRLLQDDNRGLDQAVLDNQPTLSTFRLILEFKNRECQVVNSPWGSLSESAYKAYDDVLYPPIALHWRGDPRAGPPPYSSQATGLPRGIHLVLAQYQENKSTGLIFRSTTFAKCFSRPQPSFEFNITSALGLRSIPTIHQSTLTFTESLGESSTAISLCDNQLKGFTLDPIPDL